MRTCLVVLAIASAIACTDHGAERLTKVKEAVCACETASCAEHELAEVGSAAIESNHRTQTIARDMLDCLADVQAAAPLAELKDRVCACTTAACVEAAQEGPPPSETRASKISRRLRAEILACATKVAGPSAPGSAGPASARTP